MMGRLLIGWVVCIALGCQGLTVTTRDYISVVGPVETTARISAEQPPVADAGRVVPVLVLAGAGAGPCDGPAAVDCKVALVELDGLLLNVPFAGPSSLGENPVAHFREKLDAIEADPSVRAVVLRINSPGGGVSAVETMRADLLRFRQRTQLPVRAWISDIGAGGAYYIATAADSVAASPMSVVGGVGVVLNLFNMYDLMQQFNIRPQPIKAGQRIDLGYAGNKLSDEDKALLQSIADEFHDRLKQQIVASRPQIDQDNGNTLDGRIFSPNQALSRRLIDKIGSFNETLDAARQVAGCAHASVYAYRRRNDPAYNVHASSANVPISALAGVPSVPGLDRSRLPTFLCAWQPDPTLEKISGR